MSAGGVTAPADDETCRLRADLQALIDRTRSEGAMADGHAGRPVVLAWLEQSHPASRKHARALARIERFNRGLDLRVVDVARQGRHAFRRGASASGTTGESAGREPPAGSEPLADARLDVPLTILVDRDGRVVAANLAGPGGEWRARTALAGVQAGTRLPIAPR